MTRSCSHTPINPEAAFRRAILRRLSPLLLLLCGYVGAVFAQSARSEAVLAKATGLYDRKEYAASLQAIENFLYADDGKTHAAPLAPADSIFLPDLLLLEGENFFALGIYQRAATLFESALKTADATRQPLKSAKICNALFKVHYETGNYTFATDLLTRALSIYSRAGDTEGQCKILNNIALIHYRKKEYGKSLEYYNRALRMSGNDSVAMSKINTNIAETYYIQGDYSRAAQYLDRAVALNGFRYDTSEALQAWLNKALLLAQTGKRPQALAIAADVERNMSKRTPERLVDTYTQLSEIKLATGDSIAALRDILRARTLSDSLSATRGNDQIRQLLALYNTERLQRHNADLEASVRRRNLTIVGITIASLLFVAFAIYLVRRIRADRRKNALIRRQSEQLMEFERREHGRKEKEYREELDHKNRQLTSFSIDAAAISELHKRIHDSLTALRRGAEKSVRAALDENISLLRNFTRAEVQEDFRVYFNEVNPEFLRRLSERFPNLTQMDLRLCSYLYLGMTTKEIAALTFREIRSVESSRLRLRKKLGITGDVSLHDFLHSLDA